MMNLQQRRRNPVVGCLLPILGLIVFLAACYGICLVMFLIGNPNASIAPTTPTPAGGEIFLWFLG